MISPFSSREDNGGERINLITYKTPITNVTDPNLEEKIQELSISISDVQTYGLLTTNQYLKQMKIILDIFDEIKSVISK